MDIEHTGTLKLSALKKALADHVSISDEEIENIFNAMDSNTRGEVNYSDFLAAMVSSQIGIHDKLIRKAFTRFDVDGTGYITIENLKDVLGESYYGTHVEHLLDEADFDKDGFISLEEFSAYLKGEPVPAEVTAEEISNLPWSDGERTEGARSFSKQRKPSNAWPGDDENENVPTRGTKRQIRTCAIQ